VFGAAMAVNELGQAIVEALTLSPGCSHVALFMGLCAVLNVVIGVGALSS
jgi:hypothetical protein